MIATRRTRPVDGESFAAGLKAVADVVEFYVKCLPKQAQIMRDANKTGQWEGAERVAKSLDRHAIKAREAFLQLTKLQRALLQERSEW